MIFVFDSAFTTTHYLSLTHTLATSLSFMLKSYILTCHLYFQLFHYCILKKKLNFYIRELYSLLFYLIMSYPNIIIINVENKVCTTTQNQKKLNCSMKIPIIFFCLLSNFSFYNVP